MTRQDGRDLRGLFERCLELSLEERASFLAEIHAEDPAVAEELRGLLYSDEDRSSLLDDGILGTVEQDQALGIDQHRDTVGIHHQVALSRSLVVELE